MDVRNIKLLSHILELKESIILQKDNEKQFMESKIQTSLEVIDDFIRNYMIKHKMKKTLQVFQVFPYPLTYIPSKNGLKWAKKEE